MLTKTFFGVMGAFLVIAVLIFNNSFPMLLNIIVSLLSVMCVYEISVATGLNKKYQIFIPGLLFAGLFPLFQNQLYGNIVWYIYTLIVFAAMIVCNLGITVKDVAVYYGMTTLIVNSVSFLIRIRDLGGTFGEFFLFTSLGAACFADTGAYFCGSFFGKHKLCEKISPKKTVEGLFGGTLFSVLFLNLTGFVFEKFVYHNAFTANYFLITVIAIVCSFISTIGDLSFSLIKRNCHIKDFGNLIPGHGGVLDRLDSIIFVAPFVYIVLQLIPIVI